MRTPHITSSDSSDTSSQGSFSSLSYECTSLDALAHWLSLVGLPMHCEQYADRLLSAGV